MSPLPYSGKDQAKKTKAKKNGPAKKPPINWINFLTTDDLAAESEAEADDPTYEPPEEYEDIDDFDSAISSEELKELTESMGKDLAELTINQAPEQPPETKTDGIEENQA